MILVREPHQPRRHAAREQGVVVGDAVGVGNTVVVVAVGDERGRAHAVRERARALRAHLLRVLPEERAQVLGTLDVRIGAERGHTVEDARMAHVRAVAARRHVAVHPGDEKAAVARPGGEDAPRVRPGLREEPVGARLDVAQLELAQLPHDAVEEAVTEAARAVVVHRRDHLPARGEQVRVPPVAEGVAGGRIRPAVDDVQHLVPAPRIEARREGEEHLHGIAERALEGHLARLAEGHAGQNRVVEALEAARGATLDRVHLDRVGGRVDRHDNPFLLAVVPDVESLHPSAANGGFDRPSYSRLARNAMRSPRGDQAG